MHEFIAVVGEASRLSVGVVLVFAGWQLVRLVCLTTFVVIMSCLLHRNTGRYPTLKEVTSALRRLLGR